MLGSPLHTLDLRVPQKEPLDPETTASSRFRNLAFYVLARGCRVEGKGLGFNFQLGGHCLNYMNKSLQYTVSKLISN